VSNLPNTKKNPLSLSAIIALLCLVGGYLLWHVVVIPPPTLFAHPRAELANPTWHDGAWYWIEGSGKPGSRLVRGTGSGTTDVASMDQIRSYSVGAGKVAWIAGAGKGWTVSVASLDGTARQILWSGNLEPHGICIAERRVYWLEEALPLVPGNILLPPLASTIKVISAPVEGGGPNSIAGTVMELTGEQVVGVRDGQIYVAASRSGLQGATTIYRVPLAGGGARRVAGETGAQNGMLTRNGTLYWTAPSRESSQPESTFCVRRLDRDKGPETLEDWLPGGGKLYETAQGVYYVDAGYQATAWPIGNAKTLSKPAPLPPGFAVVAVGDREMLVRQSGGGATDPLYRMPLP
jgi:hypothetical protein